MKLLKQSTQQDVLIGPLLDSGDYKTRETSVAYNAAGIDVDIIKEWITKVDISLSSSPGIGYWRHVSQANYALTLSSCHTDTVGGLRIMFYADGVLPCWEDFMVVEGEVYDALISGTGFPGPASSEIDVYLSSTHGSCSWETGDGISSSDIWTYATRTLTSFGTLVADIDSQLSSTHSSGSWEGSSAAPTVEEISNYLSCIHGSCSWETAGTVTVNSSDIWTYATRTLTSFDSLVDDIANKLSSVHGSCSWETGSGSTDWPTVEEINNHLTSQHGSGSWKTGSASGTGSEEVTYKVTEPPEETGTAIAGVFVWVTTDAVGANIVASGNTDNFGEVTFWLNPGTYYFWRQKYGYNFTNPDTEVVSS